MTPHRQGLLRDAFCPAKREAVQVLGRASTPRGPLSTAVAWLPNRNRSGRSGLDHERTAQAAFSTEGPPRRRSRQDASPDIVCPGPV
jgi:hypothetical protein